VTDQEASNRLKQWLNNGCDGMTDDRLGYIEGWFHKSDKEAFERAISSLEQEPSGDLISRQAVLEIQAKYAEHIGATNFWQMRDDIKALPSVKQERTGHWIDDEFGTKCSVVVFILI